MSNKKIKPNSMDETEQNELPAEIGQDDIKNEKDHEDVETSSAAGQDDPFADIRRSLVEEETAKREKKKSGLLNRVTGLLKGGRKKTAPLEAEEGEARAEEHAAVVEAGETLGQEAEDPSADELLAVLFPPVETVEDRAEELRSELLVQSEHPEQSEDEKGHLLEEVKSSDVLRAHPDHKAVETDFETMRGVALEGYDEASSEPEEKPAASRQRKFRVFFKSLKPIDRFMIIGALFLIFAAGTAALGLRFFNNAGSQVAATTPEPTPDVPIPVRATLPGGWEFKLSRGRVVDGRWSPAGPEWLEGTEVCRWVALPWSLQLEAVVRTLKSDDPIDLTMSNADQLTYRVQSIQNVPVDQIDSLVGKNVCLLLILVDKDSDTRWVVTAIP